MLLVIALDVHDPQTSFTNGIRAIDWAGILCILGITLMLLLGLQFGGTSFAWKSPTVICLLVCGAAMIVPFVWFERRAKYPLMPLHILQSRSNIAALVVCFFQGMVSTKFSSRIQLAEVEADKVL